MICKDCQGEMNLDTYEDIGTGEYYLYKCDCGNKVGMTLKAGECLGIEWRDKNMNLTDYEYDIRDMEG